MIYYFLAPHLVSRQDVVGGKQKDTAVTFISGHNQSRAAGVLWREGVKRGLPPSPPLYCTHNVTNKWYSFFGPFLPAFTLRMGVLKLDNSVEKQPAASEINLTEWINRLRILLSQPCEQFQEPGMMLLKSNITIPSRSVILCQGDSINLPSKTLFVCSTICSLASTSYFYFYFDKVFQFNPCIQIK